MDMRQLRFNVAWWQDKLPDNERWQYVDHAVLDLLTEYMSFDDLNRYLRTLNL